MRPTDPDRRLTLFSAPLGLQSAIGDQIMQAAHNELTSARAGKSKTKGKEKKQ